MLIWKGLGFNKEKVVAIATGIDHPSKNAKTGELIQIYVLPEEELSYRKNDSVCGDWPLSGKACYVNLIWGVRSVWQGLSKKSLSPWKEIKEKLSGKKIRFAAYGEIVLLPIGLIRKIAKISGGTICYTHQWSKPRYQKYKNFCMASVENLEDKKRANELGWKTYRIVSSAQDITYNEILCPADKTYFEKTGKKIHCSDCMLCSGTSSRTPKDICIIAHGSRAKLSNLNRILK